MNAARKLLSAVGAIALLFLGSWIGGHCSRWRAEHGGGTAKPPAIPGRLDQGTPAPTPPGPGQPPGAAIPTAPATVTVRAERLTREQLEREAARWGLVLAGADRVGAPERRDLAPQGSVPPAGGGQPQAGASGVTAAPSEGVVYPLKLAGEFLCLRPAAAGSCPTSGPTDTPTVEVTAWLLGPGEAVDLRGIWLDYQPPPPKPERWFANVGRWQGRLGLGLVGACLKDARGEMVCDGGPGGAAGLALRGWRTGHATWSLDGDLGAWKAGGTGHALLTVTFP